MAQSTYLLYNLEIRSDIQSFFWPDATNALCSIDNPLDVARSVIDRDISRLEENIRVLKSRRNELAPISRLPPEVLCNIFSFIETYTGGQGWRPGPEAWVSFSRVSQHWRSLALSAPELWTNIPLNYPRWAEEMLRRSKMANLTIQVDFAYQSTHTRVLDSIKSCLSQMIRLEEIKISGAGGLTLARLFEDLPKSAPQLRAFHMASLPVNMSGPAFTIHEDFLSDTERLKRVHLVKCKISWDSPLLTGLTHLTLHDSLKDDGNSSIIQVLHALQRMPALANLDLENSIPHDSGGLSTYPVSPVVQLPCLEVLRISSGVGAVTTVLRHITFPASVVLNLTCEETRSTQIDFSYFLSILAAKFLSSFIIRCLSLDDLPSVGAIQNGLRFQLWSRKTTQDFFQRSPPRPRLELVLAWPNSALGLQKYAKTLTAAFDTMNLRALTQLQLSTSLHIDSKTWLKTFGRLALLDRVRVKGCPASFLDALIHTTKAAAKSLTAYYNVSFPKLRYICMDGTDFSNSHLESISLDKLRSRLMERYERNAEVQELRLEDCHHLMDKDIEGLEEIVVDVHWDGIEQGFSDEYDSEERDYDNDGNTIYDDVDYYDDDDFPSYHDHHWPF